METFILTDQHLKLIRKMNIGYNDWCEFGAPEIDPKRPYGNSNVYYDIGNILGIDPLGGAQDDPEFTEEQEKMMLELHKETATALEIILTTQSFNAGKYQRENFCNSWEFIVVQDNKA